MQPGLEKVFFTLQEELLKPQAQAVYKPSDTLDKTLSQRRLSLSGQFGGVERGLCWVARF
jgi:hypothetical protein